MLLICNDRIIRDWKFRCRRLISGFGEYKTFIRINSLPLNFFKKYFVQKIMEQTTVKKTNYLEKRRSDVSWLSVLVTFSDCFVSDILCLWCREKWAFNHITEQNPSCCLALWYKAVKSLPKKNMPIFHMIVKKWILLNLTPKARVLTLHK